MSDGLMVPGVQGQGTGEWDPGGQKHEGGIRPCQGEGAPCVAGKEM